MLQTRILAVLLAVFLSALPALSQELTPKAKTVIDLSARVNGRLDEARETAQHELFADYADHQPPDIIIPLPDPHSFIAFVTVTDVGFPIAPNIPYSLVDLHVDQFLRGTSDKTDLQARSRWAPPHSSGEEPRMLDLRDTSTTTFDYTELKVGNRYLVGFSPLDVDKGIAHISGAIDLSDHDQAMLVAEVERFLGIESVAGTLNFVPFAAALNEHIPWIRDLAAQRLVQSQACNMSSDCQEALLNSLGSLLQSKRSSDRWEALNWAEPLAFPIGERQAGVNGLPPMSNAAVRELLASALSDPNLWIADKAFQLLEFFDFFHDARPSECIVIFPTLRRSVRLPYKELQGVSMSGANACTPDQPDSH